MSKTMYDKQNDYDETIKVLNSLKKKLSSLKKTVVEKYCFLGFDGYVDFLYSLVEKRETVTEWKQMETMKLFGERVLDVAGSSANIERILKRKISGGFAPNTCKAVNSLGVRTCLMAAIGFPKINDNFLSLASRESITAIPIGNPGETIGLEFNDGKVMITDFENIYKINWQLIMETVGLNKIQEELQKSDILGFGHWSLLLAFNDIWLHLVDDIFPSISNLKEKLFFVDLADIKKRSKSDIMEMLKILNRINEQIPVMLSLNDQEACDISKVLGNIKVINPKKSNHEDFVKGGLSINNQIELSYLVIHSPHFATISTKNDHSWITEGYTSTPKFTTGAGDHFNSGTSVGISCDLSPPEAILMGNAVTAIFVRTGKSPSFEELSSFIDRYMEYIESDNPNFP